MSMRKNKLPVLPLLLVLLLSLCLGAYPVSAASLKKPSGLKVQKTAAREVKLTWKKVSGAKGYVIYQKKGSASYKKVKKTGNISSLKIKNLSYGQKYYFRIRAYKTVGGKTVYSSYSSSVKITIPKKKAPIPTPTPTPVPRVFTVTPKSNPYQNRYIKTAAFTEKTRSHYVLLSYMEYFSTIGGGELHLKKGVYNLAYNLYVPSNVTLVFEDGVIIKSLKKAGLFVLYDNNDARAGVKYSGYNGVHDVKFIGKGTVIFDKEYSGSDAILMGHTKNILIQGITFANMSGKTSHFIEMDASYNVEIKNCTFSGCTSTGVKEAINLDVPDAATGGFTWGGSTMDKTADDTIYIHDNVFRNLAAGVGTHMYTPGHPHRNIRIENNTFSSCRVFAIRAQNWENSTIKNNTFTNIKSATASEPAFAVDARGISNVTVSGNTASACDAFMEIIVSRYSEDTIAKKPGLADYEPVYNSVKEEDVVYNTVSGLGTSYDISFTNVIYNQMKYTVYWNVKNA